MEQLLKYRNHIYGFCALWIMFFHVNLAIGTFYNIPLLTPFIRLGNCGVDVFLFLSGYCLALSYKRDSRIKYFYKKRFTRVLIPFLVIATPFYIFKSIIRNTGVFSILYSFLRDISGLSFVEDGVRTTWFVFAILWLYILFPAIYRIVSFSKKSALILMLALYGLIILSHFEPLHQNYSIALTRFPVFVLGSIMAYYKIEPRKSELIQLLFFIYILVFMGIMPYNDIVRHYSLPNPCMWLFFITFVLPIIYSLGWTFNKIKVEGVIMKSLLFVGNLSLEVYMIHVMILKIVKKYHFIPQNGWLVYIIVPIVTLFASYVMKKIISSLSHIVNYKYTCNRVSNSEAN